MFTLYVCEANFLFTLSRYSICNLEAALYHEKTIAIFVSAQYLPQRIFCSREMVNFQLTTET
jgi:hypothetical protein